MSSVDLFRVYLKNGSTPSVPAAHGADWIRFDDELVVAVGSGEAQQMTASLESLGLKYWPLEGRFTQNNLYLVVQKGSCFQQAHPRVRALLDHGHFLLVELDKDQSATLQDSGSHEFRVHSAPWKRTVYQTRVPASRDGEQKQGVLDVLLHLSKRELGNDLQVLTSFETRHSWTQGFRDAAAWCERKLGSMGLTVTTPQITAVARPSPNVVATKPSQDGAINEIILVVAHLDSISGLDPEAPAPGADDNASGAAGLLRIASCLQGYPNRHELRFILFTGEELGLTGSAQYVGALSEAEKRHIKAVVNMDMIASKNTVEPTVALEGTKVLTDSLEDAAGRYTDLLVQRVDPAFQSCSDHLSFLYESPPIPAALTIEGTRLANSRIHSAADTLATLDIDLALQIIRMNLAYVVELDQS